MAAVVCALLTEPCRENAVLDRCTPGVLDLLEEAGCADNDVLRIVAGLVDEEREKRVRRVAESGGGEVCVVAV